MQLCTQHVPRTRYSISCCLPKPTHPHTKTPTHPHTHTQVGEEDYNQDGKPELIRFTATAQSRYPVNSFKLLLQFSYILQVCVGWVLCCVCLCEQA